MKYFEVQAKRITASKLYDFIRNHNPLKITYNEYSNIEYYDFKNFTIALLEPDEIINDMY